MNNRQRMYASNKLARQMLLKDGYDNIWFKRHTRRKDIIFTQKGNYLATDLWNLFDGICTGLDGKIVFFQVKTNAWAKMEPIIEFNKGKSGYDILIINITKKKEWEYQKKEIKN